MTDNVNLVSDLVSPSSLIGQFIKLKPLHGRAYLGLCPFHNEKTPSFRVDDDKKFFYCFGCNKGGNIFTFLQEYKKISFTEALEEIAEKYGITLTKFKPNENKEALEQKSLLEKVSEIFASQLKTERGQLAIKYLKKRRLLSDEIIAEFKLGFCPREGDFLLSYFPDKIDEMLKLGLIGKKEDGGFYNTFGGRITFPIMDLQGKVIAFGGRIFTKEQEEMKIAKYINSKESEIFKKNRIIYGIEKAKKIRSSIIVVEGYLDVIKMHQNGFKSTVAQMGTAFSEEQINLLFSVSNEIIFCYDSDEAGRKAEKRSIELCLPFLTPQRSLNFIDLEAKDADDFLKSFGADKMSQKISQKTPLYERIFQIFSQGVNFANPNEASIFEIDTLQFCEKISNAIVKKNYQSYIKNKIFNLKRVEKKTIKPIILEKTELSSRDCMLFALFLKFPQFFKEDFYFEHFVPFASKKFEKIVKGEMVDLTLNQEISLKYPLKFVQNPKEFYIKIYNDFVFQNLNEEKALALKNNDFQSVKRINDELLRLKRGA
jgi:DNA primase